MPFGPASPPTPTTASPDSRTSQETQRRQLDALLRSAFKASSHELDAYLRLSNSSLIPSSTSAREIGLASAYAAYKRFAKDEWGLLGGGWAPWMIRPAGGDEILACCVRYAQDSIHTLLSYTHSRTLKEGDYATAKEVARKALVRALVRTGDIAIQNGASGCGARDGQEAKECSEEEVDKAGESWGRRVWTAEDEGSILEVPHLSPSLHPKPTCLLLSASPPSPPALLSPLSLDLAYPIEASYNPPPHTPADSPVLRPVALPSPTAETFFGVGVGHVSAGDEVEDGEKTPRARVWSLPPAPVDFGL